MYLGQILVTIKNGCTATFKAVFPFPVQIGWTITATTNMVGGNTSEFSPCITVLPSLMDDSSNNCVVLNSGEQKYHFHTASGDMFSGPLVFNLDPDHKMLTFQSGPDDPNLLQGSVDLMRRTGRARLEVPRGGRRVLTITDRNIDNSPPCQSTCPPPKLDPLPDPLQVNVGATRVVPLSVTNPRQACQPLAFSSSPSLRFVRLIDNGDGTGSLRLTPMESDFGNYRLTVTVTDSSSPPQSASQTIMIKVCNVDGCP